MPLVMDGYVRVSRRMGRSGAAYISPAVQRDAIQRWADYRHVTIAEWHVDEDESGGTQDRPGLREAMARVEAGVTGGIACWRLNRFARNVSAAIADVERIHAAGGQIACIEEDIDPTGPFGSFLLTVLLAVATLERDNLVAGWKTAKARAVDRGAHVGPVPYGYVRGGDGVLTPDQATAPRVTAAFERAAAGLPAVPGWSVTRTRRLLNNRVYLGESAVGEHVNPAAHPALVAPGVWGAAQPPTAAARRPNASFPLSGIARCGTCGEAMVGGRGGRGLRTYRCRASLRSYPGPACPAPATTVADRLEAHVVTGIVAAWDPPTFLIGESPEGLAEAEQALRAAEAERDVFASDLTARRLLGEQGWHAALKARVDAVTAAQAAVADLTRQGARRALVPAREDWDGLAPDELQEVLADVLEAVVVRRGRGPLAERVTARYRA